MLGDGLLELLKAVEYGMLSVIVDIDRRECAGESTRSSSKGSDAPRCARGAIDSSKAWLPSCTASEGRQNRTHVAMLWTVILGDEVVKKREVLVMVIGRGVVALAKLLTAGLMNLEENMV